MKRLKKIIKDFLIPESDKFYWDKKATVLEWQKQTGKKLSTGSTNQDIYNTAVTDGYNASWDSLADGFPDYFIEIPALDTTVAIVIGIYAANRVAKFTDRIGSEKSEKNTGKKSLEKMISKMKDKDYDKNNPYDMRSGLNHRKMGHDIFSYAKKSIPGDYVMRDKLGNLRTVADIVGGSNQNKFSMSDIINATYGRETNNFFASIWDKIEHTIFHLAKDMVTPNGVPLPFTELCNQFTTKNNVSGYGVDNKILDSIQNEFVTMRASDLTSIAFIDSIHLLFYKLKENEWKKFDIDTIDATKTQLKVLSYCSCVITQMFLYLFQTQDIQDFHSLKEGIKNATKTKDRKTNANDGGTLNWVMIVLIFKNVCQVFYYQSKTNKALLSEQQQLIDELLKEQESYGTTV